MTSGFAAVNGTQLYYEIVGQGTPLVLIHGLGLDGRVWDEQFHSLAETHRVIRYDVRGYGRSALPPTMRFRHADDLRALLDFVEVPEAHLLGLCMGGDVAIHHALLYPDATLSLTLVDSAATGDRYAASELYPPANERLHEIVVPVLVIAGELVPPDVRRLSEILAHRIRSARKVVMRGAGRLCNIERAQAFNSIVLSFLDVAEAARESA